MSLEELARRFTMRDFMLKRGYQHPIQVGDLLYGWFVRSFAQWGFHRFWRVFNPLLGYSLFLIYIRLGGRDRPFLASLLVFLGCGYFFHDLVDLALDGEVTFQMTITFVLWFLMSFASRQFERQQEAWPVAIHVLLNLGFMVLGKEAGVRIWVWLALGLG